MAIDGNDNVYIADAYDYRIRMVSTTGMISTIAGNGLQGFSGDNGLATNAQINEPGEIVIDTAGSLYFADFGNERIRYIRNATAVSNINNNQIKIDVFPNPNDGIFAITVTSNADEEVQIIIANPLGEQMQRMIAHTNEYIKMQLDVPPGIYLISICDGCHISNTKINVLR